MKNYILLVIILLFVQSCDSPTDHAHVKTGRDTLMSDAGAMKNDHTPDTLLRNQDTLVIKSSNGFLDTLLRFRSKLSEKKFFVSEKFTGKPSRLNFSYCDHGRLYQTATKNAVEESGANFAGHYTLASWGCGSPCHMSAVVDLKTGKVYTGPTSCYGYYFNVTSNVLQINPPDYDCEWYSSARTCGAPQEYIWRNNKFRLIS